MEFTKRIKELRLETGLKQRELASLLNVETRQVSRWETGYNEPNLAQLSRIAAFFKVSTDYLLGREREDGVILDHSAEGAASDAERKLLAVYRKMDETEKNHYLSYGMGMIRGQ